MSKDNFEDFPLTGKILPGVLLDNKKVVRNLPVNHVIHVGLDIPALKDLAPDELASDQRWLAVERIAGSEGFRRSPRLREFLLYVAAHQLSGHPEEITEHNVGHRVYNRRESYNPTEDNIVRVSARQLRVKLREYYESEGSSDSWVVEIPKGGYVPHFRKREAPAVTEPIPEKPKGMPPNLRHWALTALVALAATGAGWLIPHPKYVHTASISKQNSPLNLITALFHKSASPVQVVVSDSVLGLLQSMLGRQITLDEYARQEYRHLPPSLTGNPEAKQAWHTLISRQLVNIGDVGATDEFRDALATPGHTSVVVMRSAQNMRARDFRSGNFILLGAVNSDPWAQLFSDNKFDLRFSRERPNGNLSILDLRSRLGEQHLYTSGNGLGYARIALVPNLTNSGQVLLIAGTSMESTESAANFCLDPESSRALLSALGVGKTGIIPPFEALLKTQEESGTGLRAELVIARVLKSAP